MATHSEEDERPAKMPRLYFEETVHVLVGEEQKRFSVHKRALCARSTFFDSAFSGRWAAQKKSKTIELPDDDPDAFDIYLRCAYYNSIKIGEDSITNDKSLASCPLIEVQLIRAYVLADKLGDPVAANTLIDEMISYCAATNTVLHRCLINFAWENTPAKSPLRRLFVDQYNYEAPAGEFSVMVANMDKMDKISVPQEFLLQVLEEKTGICYTDRSRKLRNVFHAGYVLGYKCRYQQHDDAHPICGDDCKEAVDKDKEMGDAGGK